MNMVTESRHDFMPSMDDGMSVKPHQYMDNSTPFFEYNQISDPFSSFPPYEIPAVPHHSLDYSPHLLGLNELAYPQDPSHYSPHRPFAPMDAIQPSLTHLHSPPALSASELSADCAQSSHRSSTGSPDSQRGGAALPPSHGRAPSQPSGSNSNARFNPISTSTRTTRGRKRAKQDDSEDEEDDVDFEPTPNASKGDKREEIRRQRIESEQRRRDELREGYRRLKDALPSSNQKSSKVALLDRAVTHIRYMEMTRQQLQARLNAAEMETQRLRQVNEALMLGTAEQRAAAAAASAAVQAQVQSAY